MSKSEAPEWYKKRHYLHFDLPVSLDKAKSVVTNPRAIETHSFYPFISGTIEKLKVRNDASGHLKIQSKNREIAYAAHMDSHIYAYYAGILSERYEEQIAIHDLNENVLAFRKLDRKSNIEFANDAFNRVMDTGECTAIALDFSSFFDTLEHQRLKDAWCRLLNSSKLPLDHYKVFQSLTKYATVDRGKAFKALNISEYNPSANKRRRLCSPDEFRRIKQAKNNLVSINKTGEGIPQGSPISALLSNIYLLEFDKAMKKIAREWHGSYVRYCDDILIIVPGRIDINRGVEQFAVDQAAKVGANINKSKTEIREFKFESNLMVAQDVNGDAKPLQYLGFLFDGNKITLRSASLSRYSAKMRGGVKLARLTRDRKNRIRTEKNESPQTNIYRRKLHKLYSHRGKRNFVSYGYRAARIMNSEAIRKQLKPLKARLAAEIEKHE